MAYSVILNKDPDDYQSYTPQHKIGKSLNKEAGSLIKYYKTGQEEDGYKGYSINYQDLDIDIYKIELWKLIKDVLRLLDCDIQKLEDQIFWFFQMCFASNKQFKHFIWKFRTMLVLLY